ncbi:MAG: EAL domain-containing protein [Pseudomonadota bacterium]
MTKSAYPEADSVAENHNGTDAKVAIVDRQGTIMSVNEAWRQYAIAHGFEDEALGVGTNYLELCDHVEGPDADYARQASKALRSILAGNVCIQTFEYVCASVDHEQWTMFVASPLSSKWAPGAAILHVDISPTKDVEQALRQSEKRLREHFDALPILVAYVDRTHRYQFNNQAYESWFGTPNDKLRGKAVRDVIGDAAYQDVRPKIETCLSGEPVEFEQHLPVQHGRQLYVRGNYVPDIHESGEIRGMFAFVQDVTKERSLAVRVEHQSMHDELTGLPNRAQLLLRLQTTVDAHADQGSLKSLMILDLDDFKDINDTLGHPLGDKLLRAVARRLTEKAGPHEFVARMGGDEFAVVRIESTADCRCTDWAGQVIDHIETPFFIDGHELHINACIGIAPFRGQVDDVSQLLKQADLALYSAKAAGRGRYRVFVDRMWTDLMRRQRMTQALREALRTEQLTVRYQPQIDLKTRSIVSVEALTRWHHPTCGDIQPKSFIPIAEASGLIGKLGQWILHEAAVRAKHWRQAGHRFKIAVNVSPLQIKQPGFLDQVRSVMAAGIEPDWLEFEITEAVLVETDKRDLRILQEIVDLGIDLAIDDFGSGYSSLAYLKRLPVNKIKIEQAFVDDIGVDSDDEAIIKAIITLGHQLGKRVIAEGVETASQAAFLMENGCDEAQGFYFSRPLTEGSLMAWLDRHDVP